MNLPVVLRPIQGVHPVLAVVAQPGAKLAIPALVLVLLLPRHSLLRHTQGLVHHSAAISPQINPNSPLFLLKIRGITRSQTLTSPVHYPVHRSLLSHSLSGHGDLLGSSLLAATSDARCCDEQVRAGGNGTPSDCNDNHGGCIGNFLVDASLASLSAA